MLAVLILFPLCLALIAVVLPWYQGRSWLLPLAGAVHLVLVAMLLMQPGSITEPGSWLGLDALSRLVLMVASPLYLGCAIYAVDYLGLRRDRGNRVIVPCLLVFLSTMSLAIVSRHLGVLWVGV